MDDGHRCRSKYEFHALARLLVDRRSNPADQDSSQFPAPYRACWLLRKRAASLRSSRFDNYKCGRADGPGFGCLDCVALQGNDQFGLEWFGEKSETNLELYPRMIKTGAAYLLRRAG